ncbi:MAG: hypothetical protein VXZ82_16915 [Planctomycetota bacterium]|nr:hypothetical protein [Planctomycetota bacterium]
MNEPQCLPREALKQYLAGWSDPEQSDLIESHLAECGACEQTIVALEADPDTLVEYLAHKKYAQDPASNSLVQNALAHSRDLVGNQTQQDSSANDGLEFGGASSE